VLTAPLNVNQPTNRRNVTVETLKFKESGLQ